MDDGLKRRDEDGRSPQVVLVDGVLDDLPDFREEPVLTIALGVVPCRYPAKVGLISECSVPALNAAAGGRRRIAYPSCGLEDCALLQLEWASGGQPAQVMDVLPFALHLCDYFRRHA